MKAALIISILIALWTMIRHGQSIKEVIRLKELLKGKTIPYDDYSRYISKTNEFYRYIVELRKAEPNGNVHLINAILDEYDKLLFDETTNQEGNEQD